MRVPATGGAEDELDATRVARRDRALEVPLAECDRLAAHRANREGIRHAASVAQRGFDKQALGSYNPRNKKIPRARSAAPSRRPRVREEETQEPRSRRTRRRWRAAENATRSDAVGRHRAQGKSRDARKMG